MKKIKGFTLLELIVSLLILSVALVFAMPAFSNLRQEAYLTTQTNDLLKAYHFARNRAVFSQQRVTICRSRDGRTCYTGDSWSDGWMVFEDRANFAVRDADEKILLVREPASGGLTIVGNRPVKNYISFTPGGYARYKSGGFMAGTVTLSMGDSFRKIVLSSGGRFRVQRSRH